MGVEGFLPLLGEGRAAGMLFVVDLPYEVLAGTYSFRVPARYDVPTLLLDRTAGAEALAAASSQSTGTLRLIAQTEQAETYQLFGYLPGRDYGTEADEQIMLITHTDGPSISQDNGALGILGIVRYFSRIPREQRPRTLMIFLDNRHYMPGGEPAYEKQDYAAAQPEVYQRVIAAMGIEHLGQLEVADGAEKALQFTSPVQLSSIWTSDNERLVELAIKSVRDNRLARAQVQVPGRPGAHGGQQGAWFGLGRIAERLRSARRLDDGADDRLLEHAGPDRRAGRRSFRPASSHDVADCRRADARRCGVDSTAAGTANLALGRCRMDDGWPQRHVEPETGPRIALAPIALHESGSDVTSVLCQQIVRPAVQQQIGFGEGCL